MNSKRHDQVKEKLGHVVQINVCRLQNVIIETFSIRFFMGKSKPQTAVCSYAFAVSPCCDFKF